jgi:hypothetical protein
MMKDEQHERFQSANHELRDFLDRVSALVQGTGNLGAADLQALSRFLEMMTPEIGAAGCNTTIDAALKAVIAEYKNNLIELQAGLEQVRCVMLARRAQLEAARQHMDAFRGWAHAYRQTA